MAAIIETTTEAGTEWGVSFTSANPDPESYAKCSSREEADQLAKILNDYDLDLMRGVVRFVIEDAPMECHKWGRQPDGIIGSCGKCIACRVISFLD